MLSFFFCNQLEFVFLFRKYPQNFCEITKYKCFHEKNVKNTTLGKMYKKSKAYLTIFIVHRKIIQGEKKNQNCNLFSYKRVFLQFSMYFKIKPFFVSFCGIVFTGLTYFLKVTSFPYNFHVKLGVNVEKLHQDVFFVG